MVDKSIFWDIDRTLTHSDALIFVITGNRGGGKSYGAKKRAIKNFISKHEQFGYIRRTRDDLKDSSKEFFKDIIKNNEFPHYEFKVDGNKFYCRLKVDEDDEDEKKTKPWTDDDVCGYGFNLTTGSNKKSIPYPSITMLIYDEFLLDDQSSQQRYMKNEPRALLNLYETVARPATDHPRVVLFMLANSTSINNPYFLFFGLQMPDLNHPDKNGKYIWHHPTRPIIVENVINQKFIDAKKNTEFYGVIAGTGYDDYSLDNKFINDDDTFVEKRSSTAKPYFAFIYKNKKFGVWISMIDGLLWVSEQFDPNYPIVYSLTMKDHKPNTLFLRSRRQAQHFNTFIQAYNDGCVRFETILIKSMCYEVIKMVMNI